MEELARLRSDEELYFQNRGLVEIADVLDKNRVTFWLGGGTLLGAIRDKDFIQWDWDVECDLRSEDVQNIINELVQEFQTADFELSKIDLSFDNLKIKIKKYGSIYELLAWRLDGEFRRRKSYKLPKRFFERREEIEFRGRRYYVLAPSEEVLTWMYGDWRVPKQTSDENLYLSDEIWNDSNWRRRLIRVKGHVSRRIRKTIDLIRRISE